MYNIRDTVRVPPAEFGGDLKKTILGIAQQEYEGLLDEDMGVVICVAGVSSVGEGKVISGDGAAYHDATIDLLLYKPVLHEVVEGVVSEITEFGAFVKIGPIDGLVHVSQIIDDYINYDQKAPCFTSKDGTKKLKLNDIVTARIVSVSLKGSIANSKIGLTMRQEGLGKGEWAKIDEKKAKKAAAEAAKRPEKRQAAAQPAKGAARDKDKNSQRASSS